MSGEWSGGAFQANSRGWHLDAHGKSEHVFYGRSQKSTRTRVNVGGRFIPTVWNPGKFLRKYGLEVWQHVQHVRHVGKGYSDRGRFKNCGVPSHHSCLEQWNADGNIENSRN